MIFKKLWQRFWPFGVETRLRPHLLLGLFFLSACASSREPEPSFQSVQFSAKPKNIILLIGDGMGLSQMSAHIYWTGAGKTIFEQFPHVGFHKSHSCNDLVTDSAAGATAFACGQKTTNGAIGVLPLKSETCDFGARATQSESRQFNGGANLTPLSRP